MIFFIPSVRELLRNMFPEVDEGNEEHVGFFCLSVDTHRCSCGHIQQFYEPDHYHLVVVWEEKDDDFLLKLAAAYMRFEQNPRIVEYRVAYGPSIEFYEAQKEGMFANDGSFVRADNGPS